MTDTESAHYIAEIWKLSDEDKKEIFGMVDMVDIMEHYGKVQAISMYLEGIKK